MAGFDPDKFLIETAPAQSAGFNPDQFLAETAPAEQSAYSKFNNNVADGLKTAGKVAGAIVSPVASVIDYTYAPVRQAMAIPAKLANAQSMGDVGQAFLDVPAQFLKAPSSAPTTAEVLEMSGVPKTKQVSNYVAAQPLFGSSYEQSPMPDDPDQTTIYPSQQAAGLVDLAAGGIGLNAIGKVAGKVSGAVASGARKGAEALVRTAGEGVEFTPVADKEKILQAANNIGIKDVPKALLTDNKIYQDLEQGLSQSSTVPARQTRQQYNNFFDQLKKASDKIADLKTTDSDFSLGKDIQKGLTEEVNAKRAPVSEMYNDLGNNLKKIQVNKAVVNKTFGSLKKDPYFATGQGKDLLEEYKQIALEHPDLASLKESRTAIGDSVSKTASPLEIKRAQKLQEAFTTIRNNSVEALKSELPKDLHPEVDDLISQITLADQAHSSNIKEVNSVKSVAGNKDFNSPSTFVNKIGEMKEAELTQRAAGLDVGTMRNLQEKFPNVFEKAKTAKINDIIQRSQNANGFSDAKFTRQYNAMDQEMKDLIFSPETQKHIENLQTVRAAVPEKLGPSGTPKGIWSREGLSPKGNLQDYGVNKVLEAASTPAEEFGKTPAITAKDIVKPTGPVTRSSQILQQLKTELPSNVIPLRKAADNSDSQKGYDKWTSDGLKNLKSIDKSGVLDNPEILAKIKKNAKGQSLLLDASKKNVSEAELNKILLKIKSSYLNGGE